jgi:hypothetical protein
MAAPPRPLSLHTLQKVRGTDYFTPKTSLFKPHSSLPCIGNQHMIHKFMMKAIVALFFGLAWQWLTVKASG